MRILYAWIWLPVAQKYKVTVKHSVLELVVNVEGGDLVQAIKSGIHDFDEIKQKSNDNVTGFCTRI